MTSSLEPIFRSLIGFDTTSRNSNLALVAYVKEYLAKHNITAQLIYSEDHSKANVFATIGPAKDGGIILSGHMDTVPVDGQDWATEPFLLTAKDQRYYGRGTADMKGFLAVILSLAPQWTKLPLKRPIHLAFSYDEELCCHGAPSLIEHIAHQGIRPKLAIIGEPTNMEVTVAHKGITGYRTVIRGFSAHSSATDKGASAITTAAQLISRLQTLVTSAGLPQDMRFNPPYTTMNIGTIEGGTAVNIIPSHCAFDWEMRTLPGSDAAPIYQSYLTYCEELQQAMRKRSPECSIRNETLYHAPALMDQPADDTKNTIMALLGSNTTAYVAFATEAGLFQKAGIPSIVCGPGSIDQAHKPNEFIELIQLQKCETFLQQVASWLSE